MNNELTSRPIPRRALVNPDYRQERYITVVYFKSNYRVNKLIEEKRGEHNFIRRLYKKITLKDIIEYIQFHDDTYSMTVIKVANCLVKII